jgi:hypothetical protein
MADTKTITAGVFVVLTLLLSGAYMTADMNKTYSCNANGLVGICDKLTTNNTRCYYSINGTSKYKGCSTGWEKVNIPEPIKITNENITDGPCFEKGEYTYCCSSRQLDSGSCDFIIRKTT